MRWFLLSEEIVLGDPTELSAGDKFRTATSQWRKW